MPKISEARKTERRDQILRAALSCFARQGFHSTTLQDIRAEAGLSIGAVYSYFDSKDAIVAALTSEGRQATAARFKAARRAVSPLDQLRTMLAELKRPQNLKVYQVDVRSWGEAIGDPALRETYLTSQASLVAMLAEIAAPLAEAKDVAPAALAELIGAAVTGAMVRRAVQPGADLEPMLCALLTLLETNP